MEKQQEAAADSISTVGVNVKDYAPSEVYSSEPPPAYVRPRANAVQIARIAAVTLVAVSFILGFFMLASAYVTATVSCSYGPDYPSQQEVEDRPSFQHLVDPLETEESSAQGKREVAPEGGNRLDEEPEKPVHIKLPLQLDFDDIAGAMMEKNQRSRMNCVVEKRRAEEVMDHQPKTVRLPFGVNVTTDPRYEHITGERMAIFCESGNDQRHVPTAEPQQQQLTPIVVPIPIHHPVPVPMMPPQQGMPPQGMFPQAMQPHQQARPPFAPHHLHPAQLQHLARIQQARMMAAQAQQYQPHPQMMQHQMPPQQQQQFHQMPPQAPQGRMMAEPTMHLHLQQMQPPHPQPQQQASEEQPIHIIREEHIIPIFQVESEEAPVPADHVRPPPPPPQVHHIPIHLREEMRAREEEQQGPAQMEEQRPHYVQPRSVRSVDSVLHRREKRVKRCACDCSC